MEPESDKAAWSRSADDELLLSVEKSKFARSGQSSTIKSSAGSSAVKRFLVIVFECRIFWQNKISNKINNIRKISKAKKKIHTFNVMVSLLL